MIGPSAFVLEQNSAAVPADDRAAILADPGFGRVFTDHMVTIRYTEERGWHDHRIGPQGPLSVHPAAMSIHNAQEIFEGLKAYRLPDGGAGLFRPDANARRFRKSAERLAMVPLPESVFVESLHALVKVERGWIPDIEGSSLYLRPFMIGTEGALGVRPSTEYLYCVVASPVGSYFKGANAVTLWASETYTRAAPGGTGEAKCGGNYAGSLLAHAEAVREGCDQALFLDAAEHCWIEELGGMNIFFVFADGTLRTPPLGGTILPGVTRDSLLTLARGLGLKAKEEAYAIDQLQSDAADGRLREVFACGTAAVVTPVGRIRGRNRDIRIGDGEPGPTTTGLLSALVAIQRGRAPDPHGWTDRVV